VGWTLQPPSEQTIRDVYGSHWRSTPTWKKRSTGSSTDWEELLKALKQTSSGKAPGADGLPAEWADVLKNGGQPLTDKLLSLYIMIWNEGIVPQDYKDAAIVHIYKRKGDKSLCDNHRGISLLCIAGKIFARILLNRLIAHISDTII
jgi:hypothetical protein